jgi:hypothetical protein
LGIFFGNDGFHFVQVFFIMGMFVLAADGFDVIVALHRQDHIILAQQLFVIGAAEDGCLFLFQVVPMDPMPEIPPVMAQADIVTGKILPGPVQSGQFAVQTERASEYAQYNGCIFYPPRQESLVINFRTVRMANNLRKTCQPGSQ